MTRCAHDGPSLDRSARPEHDAVMVDDSLPKIGAPATRALASIGVTRLSQLADHRARDLLALHGFGPRAIRLLEDALREQGLSFRADNSGRQV